MWKVLKIRRNIEKKEKGKRKKRKKGTEKKGATAVALSPRFHLLLRMDSGKVGKMC